MVISDYIKELNSQNKKTFSIEILPPRNGRSIEDIYCVLDQVQESGIDFISVTHGSGGSLRGGTEAIGVLVREKYNIEPLIHLTCIDQSKEMIENNLMVLKYLGLQNILALRGDPPEGNAEFRLHPKGHKYALGLVQQINDLNRGRYLLRKSDRDMLNITEDAEYREGLPGNFSISAACYPEGHPEGPGPDFEIGYTLEKKRAGACLFFTQMLFSASVYECFLKRLTQNQIKPLIIPGIMPLFSNKQIDFVKKRFDVSIPGDYEDDIAHVPDNKIIETGIHRCVELCMELLEKGAPGIHFFSMNKGENISRIIEIIKKQQI